MSFCHLKIKFLNKKIMKNDILTGFTFKKQIFWAWYKT